MPRRKRKTGIKEATDIVMGFASLVDSLFQRYTGKTLQALLTESVQRPKELPSGKEAVPSEPGMSLADAYGFLGLKPGASLDDVKKHYRNLAFLFHPDRGSAMNDEAMKIINRAYDMIIKEKQGK